MRKNTAGQKIGAQMVSASDGSAFTGSVTVYVTGDAGTQAVGSVGSGACTHEGNGYHTYAPAQAETNCTLIAFTFIGTGAIPQTIQERTIGYDDSLTYLRADNRDGDAIPTAAQNAAATRDVDNTSPAANSLGAAINAIDSGAGTGGRTVTVTVTDGTDPVENATVRLTQGAETVSDRTDASGIALLYVDDATWSYVVTKTRYAAATGTVVVDGNESVPVTLSVLSLTPSDPDRTTGFLTVYDMAGDPAPNIEVTLKITAFASGTTGIGIDSPERTQTTDADGLVEFVGLPRLATYSVRIGTASGAAQGTTEDAATTPLVNVLGEVAVA